MTSLTDRKLCFLRTIYRKYSVRNEDVIEAVIKELERRDQPLIQDLMLAYQQMCCALSQVHASERWFHRAYHKAVEAFHAAEKEPLQRVLALKIIITSMIMRCSMGNISEKDAMEEAKRWIEKINMTEMKGVMQCIQNTKPTVTKNMQRVMRKHSSKFLRRLPRCSKELIYLEFVKLAVATTQFFSSYDRLRKVTIYIPSRMESAAPYGITIGALFMNFASYIIEKEMDLCYDGDPLYFIKELTMMKGTLDFIAYELSPSDIDGWRSRVYSNERILQEIGRKMFTKCTSSSDYQDEKGNEIERGETVEIIEPSEDGYDSNYLVRKDNKMFHVPQSCFAFVDLRDRMFYNVMREFSNSLRDLNAHV